MSGGPCYLINQNENEKKIIGVHCCSGWGTDDNNDNSGAFVTTKVQELITFAERYVNIKENEKTSKNSKEPPKQKAKTKI